MSREEGMNFARSNGCLFLECSAKTKVSVREVGRCSLTVSKSVSNRPISVYRFPR